MHLFSSQNCKELLRLYFERSKNNARDLVIVPSTEVKDWLEYQQMQKWGSSLGVEIVPLANALPFFFQYQDVWKAGQEQISCMTHSKTLFFTLLNAWKTGSAEYSDALEDYLCHIEGEEEKIGEILSLSRNLFEISESGAYDALLISSKKQETKKSAFLALLYQALVLDCSFTQLPRIDLSTLIKRESQGKVLSHRLQWHLLQKNWQPTTFPFKRTSFFAPNHFSQPLLEFLEQIHSHQFGIEVDIYQVSPSAYPWYDAHHLGAYAGIEFSNRLLDRLTLFARDGVRRVYDLSHHCEDFYSLEINPRAPYRWAPAKAPYISSFCHGDAPVEFFPLLKQIQADFLSAIPSAAFQNDSGKTKELQNSFSDESLQFLQLGSKQEEVEKAVEFCLAKGECSGLIFAPSIENYREEIHYVCQRAGVRYVLCENGVEQAALALQALMKWMAFAQNGASTRDFSAAFKTPLGKEVFGFEERDFLIFEFLHSLGLEGGLCEEIQNSQNSQNSWCWAVSFLQEYALGARENALEALVSLKGSSTKEILDTSTRFSRLLLWCGGLKQTRSLTSWMQWMGEQLRYSNHLTQIHEKIELDRGIEENAQIANPLSLIFFEFWTIWLSYAKEIAVSREVDSQGNSYSFFDYLGGNALCFTSLSDFASTGTKATAVIGMDEESFEQGSQGSGSFLRLLSAESGLYKAGSRGSHLNYYLLLALMAAQERFIMTCSPGRSLSSPCQAMQELQEYAQNRLFLCPSMKKQKKVKGAAVYPSSEPVQLEKVSPPLLPDLIHISFLERMALSPTRGYKERSLGATAPSHFYPDYGPLERPPFLSKSKESRIEQHLLTLHKSERGQEGFGDLKSTPKELFEKQLYLPGSKDGLYAEMLHKAMRAECDWQERSFPYLAFSQAIGLLYGKAALQGPILPAVEVQTSLFQSRASLENQSLFPQAISVEGVLPTRSFDSKEKIRVFHSYELLRFWPSLLLYTQYSSRKTPLSLEFFGGPLKGKEVSLGALDPKKAFQEWVEWALCSLCEPAALQPLWIDLYLRGNFEQILNEIEKALQSEKSLVQEDPFLLEWVWMNKDIDFEKWLKAPQVCQEELTKIMIS